MKSSLLLKRSICSAKSFMLDSVQGLVRSSPAWSLGSTLRSMASLFHWLLCSLCISNILLIVSNMLESLGALEVMWMRMNVDQTRRLALFCANEAQMIQKNPGRVAWLPGSPPNLLRLLPRLPLHHRPHHCRHHHREISGWKNILFNIFSYPHHCSHHMPHYHCDISNQACVTVLSYSNKYQYRNHHHQHHLSEHRHHQALCRPTQYRLRSNSPGTTLARYVGTSLTLSLLLNIPRYRYDHQRFDFCLSTLFFVKGLYQWPHAA